MCFAQDALRFWDNPLLLTGLLLLLIAVGIGLIRSRKRQKPILVNDGESGQVVISHRAVRDLVAHTCNDIPSVRYNKSRLEADEESYRLQVHILVAPHIRLGAISQYLQEQLATQLSNNLELNGLSGIDIIVDGFLPNPTASGKKISELPSTSGNTLPSQSSDTTDS